MSNYGVTNNGFVLKRLDTILEEIHTDLTEGFGFDTRLTRPSALDTLVTSFAGQIADLWETAQASYYAKYPATAVGINLDNAVLFGGIRRQAAKQTSYPIHCLGVDGTVVPKNTVIATNTSPQKNLYAIEQFTISRSACNAIQIIVSAVENATYSVTLNGTLYSVSASGLTKAQILTSLATAFASASEYTVSTDTVDGEPYLTISDLTVERNNTFVLSDNLTTLSVVTIATFNTEDYGKIAIPNGVVSKIITNVTGLTQVTNVVTPIYGRNTETDVELRQSYIAKSALRSSTMLESITSQLLANVNGVISAAAYENDTDSTTAEGLPPHSIEVVCEGGDVSEIAEVILAKKAGGIQTHGNITVDVPTKYGQTIPIKFSRPTYLYTWIKVILHGSDISSNYSILTKDSIMEDTANMNAGEDLLIQRLNEGIYDCVNGITYIEIKVTYSTNKSYIPSSSDYVAANITTSKREMIVTAADRIEVSVSDS